MYVYELTQLPDSKHILIAKDALLAARNRTLTNSEGETRLGILIGSFTIYPIY